MESGLWAPVPGKNPYHEFLHLHRRQKRRLLLVVTCFEKCVGRLFSRSVAVKFLSNQLPSSRFLPVLIMNTSLIPAPFFGWLQFLLQLDLLLKIGSWNLERNILPLQLLTWPDGNKAPLWKLTFDCHGEMTQVMKSFLNSFSVTITVTQ